MSNDDGVADPLGDDEVIVLYAGDLLYKNVVYVLLYFQEVYHYGFTHGVSTPLENHQNVKEDLHSWGSPLPASTCH